MKRKFLTMFLALAASLCLCFGLAACGAGFSVEGTYYLVEHDEYDMKTYFILKGGKWTDEDGVSGDYEISGEKITLYTDIFGEKAEFTGGTLKDGVLTVEGVFGNKVFAKEGAWKGASGGSQGSGQTTPGGSQGSGQTTPGGSQGSGQTTPYTKSEDGTKIYFGEYPQTEVKGSGLKGFLGMEAGANPTSSNKGKWTDYGYYIDGSVSSYMWYIDVEYQGNRYRGVYFTSYRPEDTTWGSSTGRSYQDDNGYRKNTVYWFKYEPIEWRVLEENNGTAFLMANIILDSQQYYRTRLGTRTVNGKTVYENNYKESDIRAWLNETFYETAFDGYAQEIIETTTVDNSASSTASDSNSYACENTQDKVFLLSYKEMLNTSYGFSSAYSKADTARQLKSTDYARSQGVYVFTDSGYRGNGWWWLRSPHGYDSYIAISVYSVGDAYYYNSVNHTYGGVVPALRIRL